MLGRSCSHDRRASPTPTPTPIPNHTQSVEKGRLNGKTVWTMAYETAIAGTPGAWNTAFATSPAAKGPWTVLDDSVYRMAIDVEHADPALRYVEEDGFWYCIPARKSPVSSPNGGWYFFQEVRIPVTPSDLPPPLDTELLG